MKTKAVISNLVKILIYFGFLHLANAFWQLMEFVEYGQLMPSTSDSVIAVILAYSLYKNLTGRWVIINDR